MFLFSIEYVVEMFDQEYECLKEEFIDSRNCFLERRKDFQRAFHERKPGIPESGKRWREKGSCRKGGKERSEGEERVPLAAAPKWPASRRRFDHASFLFLRSFNSSHGRPR